MSPCASDELGELFTALSEFQSKVGAIPKGATNPFFKSKYAELPDVMAVASPILAECGLAVTQLLGHDDRGDTLTTIVGHKSGQFIGDTMQLRPVKDDPQGQGSATTYGRRYALMAALGLVADEDDDGNKGSNTQPRAKPSSASKNKAKANPQAGTAKAKSEAEKTADDPERVIYPKELTELRTLVRLSGADEFILRGQLVSVGVGNAGEGDLAAIMEGLTKKQAKELGNELQKTVEAK